MNAYKKYKNRLERFLQTERGKRFINFAYSFGAAVVILGAMFKLLHFPFGNEMLFIGMVTECVVFILSAFDTPIRDYRWEHVFPALVSANPADVAGFNAHPIPHSPENSSDEITPAEGRVAESNSGNGLQGISSPPEQRGSVRFVQGSPGTGLQGSPHTGSINIPPPSSDKPEEEIPHNLSVHTEEYGRQMENLNRTLSGLNSIYEIQLKSVSSQIGAIEQINAGLARLRTIYGENLPDGSVIKTETEKMADQLRELNQVYARMLNAMTVDKHGNPDHSNP